MVSRKLLECNMVPQETRLNFDACYYYSLSLERKYYGYTNHGRRGDETGRPEVSFSRVPRGDFDTNTEFQSRFT